MKAAANGIAIDYVIDGPEGAPWVTFSTKISNDATLWDDHVAGLTDRYRLLRYDSRGHGGTAATAGDYTFDLLNRDLLRPRAAHLASRPPPPPARFAPFFIPYTPALSVSSLRARTGCHSCGSTTTSRC